MKKLLTFSFLILSIFTAKGQSVSGKDLVSIVNAELIEINEVLRLKGWEYNGNDEERLSYGFNVEDGLSEYWLYVYNDKSRVSYTFNSDKVYNNLLAYIVSINAKPMGSLPKEEFIISEYWSKNYVFNIKTYTKDADDLHYNFTVWKREAYFKSVK
jgi:hypothetical protein